jgi:glycine/D-amino acid oxidase-like deaminating enzyme
MVEFGIPYWWEQGKSFPDFPKKSSEYCDLLVIGAGFTGLSASITSSGVKIKTICVDKGIPGEGASTRNGGLCGVQAYENGDYATALTEWAPLAEQGNANAQFNLAQMYRRGEGVPQNYKMAVMLAKVRE